MFPEDSYRRILANRSFLIVWFGQGLASLGQAVLYVVVALYVYDLTGQEFGLLHATMSLSIAITVFILGHLAGRMHRARLLVGGVVVAGLAYIFFHLI